MLLFYLVVIQLITTDRAAVLPGGDSAVLPGGDSAVLPGGDSANNNRPCC